MYSNTRIDANDSVADAVFKLAEKKSWSDGGMYENIK